jgi:hypothetical protein
MTEHDPNERDQTTDASGNASGERMTEPRPDRPPTPDEEAAAGRARGHVDVPGVAEHYEEMTDLGANVRGEGQIEPD